MRDLFCEKKSASINALPFRRNMGLKTREKISNHFLRFLVLVHLQGLFLKISHQAMLFSARHQSLLSWLCSQHVTSVCQQNMLCQKAAKPSKEFKWCLLGRAPFTKTTVKKSKKISWRGSTAGVEQRFLKHFAADTSLLIATVMKHCLKSFPFSLLDECLSLSSSLRQVEIISG